MIIAKFYKSSNNIIGFSISGHAYFDEYGKDIVCASVTSAVQLTSNAITECLKDSSAKVDVFDNNINLFLSNNDFNESSVIFIEALIFHLDILSKRYVNTIKIEYQEV